MSQTEQFIDQIKSLPDLIAQIGADFEPRTRTLLSTPEIYGLRQIILTGSGDSYFAAAAAAHAIRGWTGLPVQAMTAMEAARYAASDTVPPRSVAARGLLVIAVSYSGEAARVVEAMQRLRAAGALTIAVSANAQSRLARAAERQIDTTIAPFASAPGSRTYLASLVTLLLIGIRLSEVLIRMTMDHANDLRRTLIATGQKAQGLVERCSPRLEEFAQVCAAATAVDVLGSGPSLASASYMAAKLVEAAGLFAAPQDAEEFHHLNFFLDDPRRIATVAFAPTRAAAASRYAEMMLALGELERPALVISDAEGAFDLPGVIALPQTPEYFAPLLEAIPGALLAALTAQIRGVPHYRGHTGSWSGAQGAGFVKNSAILAP